MLWCNCALACECLGLALYFLIRAVRQRPSIISTCRMWVADYLVYGMVVRNGSVLPPWDTVMNLSSTVVILAPFELGVYFPRSFCSRKFVSISFLVLRSLTIPVQFLGDTDAIHSYQLFSQRPSDVSILRTVHLPCRPGFCCLCIDIWRKVSVLTYFLSHSSLPPTP